MGISCYIYVGPYLECKRTATKSIKEYGCSNGSCLNNRRSDLKPSNFCAQCGSAIQEFKKEKVLSGYEASYQLPGEKLFARTEERTEDYEPSVFLPNREYRSVKGSWRKSGFGDFRTEDIPAGTREQEMAEFWNEHVEEIKKLKTIYGEENVEMRWGLVTDYR